MPEIRDYYSHVKDMDITQLHQRRNELVSTAPSGQYRDLEDEALAELLAITREMRKRAAVGTKRTAKAPRVKVDKESLDALL
jgi:hypothetical protein